MLTKHCYQPIPDRWEGVIEECCKTVPPGGSNCSDCCYDSWQDELNQISAAYNLYAEKTIQLQSEVDSTAARRDKYLVWLAELTRAELLARETCDQLKLIAVQLDKIWYNSCQASDA